ncbi:hypothetical protein IT570_10520 [Candidatus Sumerlaeota bacterium]|nr:hypothetical protein [Candidatus Sumerlaeota bacterium]
MRYPHRAHQLEHHDIFKADATYCLSKELHDKEAEQHLTFAWWNAPLLVGLHVPIFASISIPTFFIAGWPGAITALASALVGMGSYYALYEYVHFCMHVPADRSFERTKFFQFINNHHRLHHIHYKKNLNVVIPIADFCLGTMVKLDDPELFNKLEAVRRRRAERKEAIAAAAMKAEMSSSEQSPATEGAKAGVA